MADDIAIEAFGDAAVLVRLGSPDGGAGDAGSDDPVEPERVAADRAQQIAEALEPVRASAPALRRAVPASSSVLVPFDPLGIELEDVIAVVRRAISADSPASRAPSDAAPTVDVPTRYGGEDGPDLDAVAELAGLRAADVIELHAGALYRVLFLGFAPGFAYLAGLPVALAMPRRQRPRERVPSGSVAIAGRQTAIYPRSMPGGWQLIGRTDVQLFDPSRSGPALLEPRATVRFVPVSP